MENEETSDNIYNALKRTFNFKIKAQLDVPRPLEILETPDCYLVFYFSGSVRVQRVVRGKVLKVVGAGKVIADWCI